jgi:hypothetical protein
MSDPLGIAAAAAAGFSFSGAHGNNGIALVDRDGEQKCSDGSMRRYMVVMCAANVRGTWMPRGTDLEFLWLATKKRRIATKSGLSAFARLVSSCMVQVQAVMLGELYP